MLQRSRRSDVAGRYMDINVIFILKTSYFPDSDWLSLGKVKKSRPPLKMMMPTMMTKIRLVRMMNMQETLHTLHTDLVFNFLLDSASDLICCLAPWCSYNLYLYL